MTPACGWLVYGDSFVEADYTAQPETFAKRLEARLASALGRSVEGVNAGVNGYGPDQALVRFEDEAARLRPALAVVVVYAGNDFGDVLRNRLFRLEDGRLVEGGGFVAESLWWQFEDARRRTPFHLLRGLRRLRNAHRRAAADAQLPEKLGRYVARSVEMCADEYRAIVVQGERAVDDVFRDHYDADVALAPDSPAAAYKRDLLEAVLGRWREAAAAARVPLLVLVVPPAIDVCDSFDVKVDRAAYPGYDPARLSRSAAEAARRQGLRRGRALRPLPRGGRRRALPAEGRRPLERARPGPRGAPRRRARSRRGLARPPRGRRRNPRHGESPSARAWPGPASSLRRGRGRRSGVPTSARCAQRPRSRWDAGRAR